MIVFRSS